MGVRETEGEALEHSEGAVLGVALGQGDMLGDWEPEGQEDGDMEDERVGAGLVVVLVVPHTETETLGDSEEEAEGVEDGQGRAEGVAQGLGEALGVEEALELTLTVKEELGDNEGEEEAESEVVPSSVVLAELEWLPVRETELQAEREALGEAETEAETLREGVREGVEVAQGLRVVLGEEDELSEGEGVAEKTGEAVELRECDELADANPDTECVAEAQ